MSVENDLIIGVRAKVIADTGTGGLLHSGTSFKITACYAYQAPQQAATLPYIVILPVSNVEIRSFSTSAGRAEECVFQISIFTDKDGGPAVGSSIAKRLATILNRIVPTVTGYSPSQMLREDSQAFIEEDNYHHIEQYRCLVAV